MDCLRVRNFLNAYVDFELSSSMMGEIRSHLDMCPDCSGEAEYLRNLSESLDNLPGPSVSKSLTRRILKAFRIERQEAGLIGYWGLIYGYMDGIIYGMALAGFVMGLLLGTSVLSLSDGPCAPYILACADTEVIFR